MKLRRLKLTPTPDTSPMTRAANGAAVNYLVFGGMGESENSDFAFDGVSGAVEARAFGPWGTLSQSALATKSSGRSTQAVRLDTVFAYDDHARMLAYQAGDLITRGPSWSRPVRLGGLQVARRFDLRPDVLTRPMPTLSGTAQAPSTLDLYVNGVKTYSAEAAAGPFALEDVPLVDGAGSASVVVQDALGRRTLVSLPFYASSALLAPGLLDFAGELGFARREYGAASNDYDGRPAGSVSVRRGLTSALTAEAHAEAATGLFKAGAGAVRTVGPLGLASAALALSTNRDGLGGLLDLGWETRGPSFNISTRVQRTFGAFHDLASWTAPSRSDPLQAAVFRAPRSLDQVQVSAPSRWGSQLSLNYTGVKHGLERIKALGLALSWSLGPAQLQAAVFRDLARAEPVGFQLSLRAPLRGKLQSAVGASGSHGTGSIYSEVSRQAEVGELGWRVGASEGATQLRQAGVSFEGLRGRIDAEVQQANGRASAWGQLSGAVAFVAGRPFFSRRLDGPFAVVDAGAAGLEVRHENRVAGSTGRDGLLLIPGLVPHQANRIDIDPTRLPIDAELVRTEARVKPADRTGVVLRMRPAVSLHSAVVVLVDPAGAPLPAGARARLSTSGGGEELFLVGYDGETYVRGLGPRNILTVELPDGGSCRAEFPFEPHKGRQVRLERVSCRRVVMARADAG
jgi:outer membrane usher protein